MTFPRPILAVLGMLCLFVSCKKDIEQTSEEISLTVESDATNALTCISTNFVTHYSINPGQVPPFKFTKTLGPDGKVKYLSMLSRANPPHAGYKPQAWEVIGSFVYFGKDSCRMTGTKQLWEYYKTATGGSAKKSILKKNISLSFKFWNVKPPSQAESFNGSIYEVYNNMEKQPALLLQAFGGIIVAKGSDEAEVKYDFEVSTPEGAELDVIVSRGYTDNRLNKRILYDFTDVQPSNLKNVNYIPSQNWISLEYCMAEVMQWLGIMYPVDRQRSKVSVEYYPYNNSTKVTQSQVYKNHKYDANGNLTSYTYGDNVLQKTWWRCQ